MQRVERSDDLAGLGVMLADLIEHNIEADDSKLSLLDGPDRKITITASDLDLDVKIVLGMGQIVLAQGRHRSPHLWIYTDSETLLDLSRVKLLAGLPSFTDPLGRQISLKLMRGKLKIKGLLRLPTLARLQRLLSVSGGSSGG